MTTKYSEDRKTRFVKCLEYLEELVDSEKKRMDEEYATIDDVVRSYGLIVEFYERLDAVKKQVGATMNIYKVRIVPDVLQDQHGQSNGRAEGFCKTNLLTAASVKVEDKHTLHEWLKEHGQGNIITETVSSNTLSKIAKDAADGVEDVQWIYEVASADIVRISDIITARLERGKDFIKPNSKREENSYV